MKRRNLLFFAFLIACCIRLSAQETAAQKTAIQEHTFSFRAGYGNILEGTSGLTKQSHSYERDLSTGVSWEAEYFFHFTRIIGVGVLYSGFSSKGAHEEGSDHLYTHYIAPQVGFYLYQNNHVHLRADLGMGAMTYRNNSKVFGKNRIVKKSEFAGNAGINFTYKLTRHWNLEADAKYIVCTMNKIKSRYHDEIVIVKFNKYPLSVSRLNLSAGISYSF